MATRGPKPTPRNLRLVKGTDRPSRMNDDEPILPVTIPDPPEHLGDRETDKFREMAAKLARMRVMSDADIDALAMYCVSWIRMIEADRRVAEMGEIVAAPKTRVPMQNPWLAISNKARAECRAILVEFGMTPSSRTRVKSS